MYLKNQLPKKLKNLLRIEVDVGKFKRNIRLIRDFIGGKAKIVLAAKSNVYSLGSELVKYGEDLVDGIAVENLNAAFRFALAGFRKDIYILSPFLPQNLELIPYLNRRKSIISCLDSVEMAQQLVETCRRDDCRIRVAIKVNCGLNRFGIMPHQVEKMMNILTGTPVEVDSVYTHFSGTTDGSIENLKDKEARFLSITEAYRKRGIKVHVADSACTVRKVGLGLDLVRIGLLPLGIDPVEVAHDTIPGLELCFKVLSTVLHTTRVKKGEELGYRYFAPENKKIATIYGGYAHGLPRDASFRSYALIKGIKCAYAGKSFMEYSLIDISHCDFPVKVGDDVEVFSDHCHPFQHAVAVKNIPEIFFTALSESIERVYKDI